MPAFSLSFIHAHILILNIEDLHHQRASLAKDIEKVLDEKLMCRTAITDAAHELGMPLTHDNVARVIFTQHQNFAKTLAPLYARMDEIDKRYNWLQGELNVRHCKEMSKKR